MRGICDPIDRLQGLSVGDVMCRNVMVVPASASMHEAAAMLCAAEMSGAPVADETGRCIGVLSAQDFLKCEARITRGGDSLDAPPGHVFETEEEGPTLDLASDNSASVRGYMSTAVQTLQVDAPLLKAARIMCAQHIHRIIVLDDRSTPVGVVTTLDVAAALIAAIDEERQDLSRKSKANLR